MKRYRHRRTNLIFRQALINKDTYIVDNNKLNELSSTLIHKSFIESSVDFYELGKLLFVSEDFVEVFGGDLWYYVTIEDNPIIRLTNTLDYKGSKENLKLVKRFSTKEAAYKFAESLKTKIGIHTLEQNAKKLKISKTTLSLIKEFTNNNK